MTTVWEVRRSYTRENTGGGEGGHLLVEEEGISAHSESCLERTFHCLSHVPCASLIAWIALLVGLGGFTGSLLVSADRTRDILDDEHYLWFIEYSIIGIVSGMFVIGTGLLIMGHFSSEPNCRHSFNTSGKNLCGRVANIFLMVLSYILGVAWLLSSAILIIPVAVLTLLVYLVDFQGANCINLEHYGFKPREICGTDLERFNNHGKDLLVCYGATYISSVIVVISLIHFLMIMSANVTHLRDARFATMNAYDDAEEAQNAKQLNDTTM